MPIGDLTSKVSKTDLANTNNKVNHGEYEDGFEGNDMGDGGDDFEFDSLDGFGDSDLGGSSSGLDEFGGSSGGLGGLGGLSGLSGLGGLGGADAFGFGGFGNAQIQNQVPAEPPKESAYDKAWDFSVDGIANTFKVIVEMVNSIKNRNIDDWSLLSQSLLQVGGIMLAIGTVGLFVGIIGKVRFMGISGMTPHIMIAGCFDLFLGLCGLGVAALLKLSGSNYERTGGNINSIPVSKDTEENNASITEEVDSEFDSLMADLFSDDDNEESDEYSQVESDASNSESDDNIDFSSFGQSDNHEQVDFKKLADEVPANQPLLNREFLFNTFSKFFITNTPDFNKKVEMDTSTEKYLALVTLLNQALASALRIDEEEMDAQVEMVEETIFAYIITFKRPKGAKNVADIERELVDFFKEDEKDDTVTAIVRTKGSFYVATISKGTSAVITIGDCVRTEEARKYFCNSSHRLPFIMGIDDYGQAMYDDCKNYTSMMVAGIARSGKSWYLLSIIMTLACFNTPEDVQFILADPKDTTVFKRLKLLPHVCGTIHGDKNVVKNINGILEDIINTEAIRRKKIQDDNCCDDIWALRDKGIHIPFLFIVIDEIMTVINGMKNLKDDSDKILTNNMLTIMTQFPSVGIGLIFVPHRATGVIEKTQRNIVPFTAAIKAKNEDILDTLGIKKWSRPLTQPGEMAVNTSFLANPMYLRGTGITLDDNANNDFIPVIAKTFYKMGVELPDMTSVGRGYTRDEEAIKKELELATNTKVQFDLDNLDEEEINF